MASCLWLENARAPETQPLPIRSDVAIVGAGFCGLAAALRLQQQGAGVCVLDAGDLERTSSVRNAGMVCATLAMGAVAGEAVLGQALWPVWQMTRRGADFLYSLQPPATSRAGSFMLASNAASEKAMEAEVAARMRLDFPAHMRYRQQQSLPLGANAALWTPEDFGIQPYAAWQQMLQKFVDAGGTVCNKVRVCDVGHAPGRVVLDTSAGRTVADTCFIATGETTAPSWVPAVHRQFVPLRIAMTAVHAPQVDWQEFGIVPGALYWDDQPLFHYFWVTPDGHFTFGGEAIAFPAASAGRQERLHTQAMQVLQANFPALYKCLHSQATARTYVWSGHIIVTPDSLPIAWRPDGKRHTYGLLGFSGHGLSCGVGMGQAMAELMLGRHDSAAHYLVHRRCRRDVAFSALARMLRAPAIADVATMCYKKFL